MNKTTYWCDRCGIEDEDLYYVNVESERAIDTRPARAHYELCAACKTEVFAAFEAAMTKCGTA